MSSGQRWKGHMMVSIFRNFASIFAVNSWKQLFENAFVDAQSNDRTCWVLVAAVIMAEIYSWNLWFGGSVVGVACAHGCGMHKDLWHERIRKKGTCASWHAKIKVGLSIPGPVDLSFTYLASFGRLPTEESKEWTSHWHPVAFYAKVSLNANNIFCSRALLQ